MAETLKPNAVFNLKYDPKTKSYKAHKEPRLNDQQFYHLMNGSIAVLSGGLLVWGAAAGLTSGMTFWMILGGIAAVWAMGAFVQVAYSIRGYIDASV